MRSDWSDSAFDLQKSNQHSLKQTLYCPVVVHSQDWKAYPCVYEDPTCFTEAWDIKSFFHLKCYMYFQLFTKISHTSVWHFCVFLFSDLFSCMLLPNLAHFTKLPLEYLMKKHLRAYGQNASLMQSSKDSIFFSQNCSNSPSLIFHLTRAVRGAGAYPSSQ